ncbi:MAG: YidC/Oxa1 family rane protein insertase [Actinomycetota bacterium]|nr:YidC/Oxa1 family rane protein insertase [Actinomycetota bacterium]
MTLDPLYRVIGYLLAIFYVPFHSLGLAIILLTLVIMLVQFPLIAKQARSMIQMQRVQPEIKKIQAKYKDDKAKQNEELLKFYQENKINPLAGCLPMVVTIPIGIAVFRTFSQGLQKHLPQTSGSLGKLYSDVCHGNPNAKACGKEISKHTPQAMRFLGMSLNLSAREIHGFPTVLPYYILVGLVVLTGWYQVRQTQARQLQSGNAPPNAQMQAMTKVFPVIFGLITLGINAAATTYFVVSNAWRIGQQHLVIGKMYDDALAAGELKPSGGKDPAKKAPDDADGESDGNGAEPSGKSKPKTPPGRKPSPGAKQPGPKAQTGKASGTNGDGGRQGMTPGARRKKRRKR